MSATPEREQVEALRTPEQMAWIRDHYKPDGLRRLARSNRHYADEHGVYLPDVAALAHAEWERANDAVDLAERLAVVLGRAVFVAEHLMAMIPRETWLATGGDDGQGHYEGDWREEQTAEEIKGWADLLRVTL